MVLMFPEIWCLLCSRAMRGRKRPSWCIHAMDNRDDQPYGRTQRRTCRSGPHGSVKRTDTNHSLINSAADRLANDRAIPNAVD